MNRFFFGAWPEGLIVFVDDDANFLHKTDLVVIIAFCSRQLNLFNWRASYSFSDTCYRGSGCGRRHWLSCPRKLWRGDPTPKFCGTPKLSRAISLLAVVKALTANGQSDIIKDNHGVMNEGAVFLVVVVLAVLSYRYFAGPGDGPPSEGGSTRSDPRTTASRGRPVTPAMVEIIQTMFPHIPPSAIAYDLSRTGSVEITTNNILSRNSLAPAPRDSPYHQLFPTPQAPSSSSSPPTASKPDLISRYNLEPRLSESPTPEPVLQPTDKGKGKAPSQWSQSQAERENNFKRRRDDMILRARRQLQDKVEPT